MGVDSEGGGEEPCESFLSTFIFYFIHFCFLIRSSRYIAIKEKAERESVAETPMRKAADADQGYDGGRGAGGSDGGYDGGDRQQRRRESMTLGAIGRIQHNIDRNNITKIASTFLLYLIKVLEEVTILESSTTSRSRDSALKNKCPSCKKIYIRRAFF